MNLSIKEWKALKRVPFEYLILTGTPTQEFAQWVGRNKTLKTLILMSPFAPAPERFVRAILKNRSLQTFSGMNVILTLLRHPKLLAQWSLYPFHLEDIQDNYYTVVFPRETQFVKEMSEKARNE